MITLNLDFSLKRVESWEEIISLAGFTPDVDPASVKLKAIIGSYQFQTFIKCGLRNCHQAHGKGYLVTTENGLITNIGNGCGKTHFSVDFQTLCNKFDLDVRNKERRENLSTVQHLSDEYLAKIATLQNQNYGANWAYKKSRPLIDNERGLPDSIRLIIKNLIRTKTSALTIEREATEKEIEIAMATGKTRAAAQFIQEYVGELIGVDALYPENNLRELLVLNLMQGLEQLIQENVDLLSDRKLANLNKWANEIEFNIQKAEKLLSIYQQLLTYQNIIQLAKLTSQPKEKKLIETYAKDLILKPQV
ncbi:MAG: hypothetical protein Q7S87_00375 [Agitococcus sp.]|nr:hypothetical protein [Agitococcus sp.]